MASQNSSLFKLPSCNCHQGCRCFSPQTSPILSHLLLRPPLLCPRRAYKLVLPQHEISCTPELCCCSQSRRICLQVYLAMFREVTPVAVKVLSRKQDPTTHSRFLNEIQLLRNARSPYVVQYVPRRYKLAALAWPSWHKRTSSSTCFRPCLHV